MLAVIVVCAIAGDSTGFEVGKLIGPWLLDRKFMRSNLGVHKARELIARFGGPAVFIGRWVALARALVPGLSGMSGMRYRTFLFWNALGGIVWGTTFVMVGYAAGHAYEKVAKTIGMYTLIVVGVVVVAVAGWILFRRRREHRERKELEASGQLGGSTGHDDRAPGARQAGEEGGAA